MRNLALLATAILMLFVPVLHAENCNTEIIDKANVVFSPQVITSAASTLVNQGADVRVVIVDSIQRYGSNLSDVERYFEQSCPNWTVNGQRKANLFVVMVAPNDRQKNLFLGSYYAGAFDIPSTFSQLSNTYFKNRQWEMGVAAVLQGTTSNVITFHTQQLRRQQQQQTRTYTGPGAAGAPIQTQQASDSHVGLWIFLTVLLLGVIGLVAYFIFRSTTTDTSTVTETDDFGHPVPYTDPNLEPTSYTAPRTYAAAAPSHTTVVNNYGSNNSGDGFVSGLVVGEMLSRPNPVYVDRPVYEQPSTPVYEQPSTPVYEQPSAPAPTQDAPDSTWQQDTTPEPSTDFSTPDPPSSDFGSSSGGDTGF